MKIYENSSIGVVRVLRELRELEVFESFYFGKNFFSEREIDRAFSKFCRLIVSINFPFARPRRYNDIVIK